MFFIFGNPKLSTRDRVFCVFISWLSKQKHFREKYLKKLKSCRVHGVNLVYRIYLQNRAEKFHGTVSRGTMASYYMYFDCRSGQQLGFS